MPILPHGFYSIYICRINSSHSSGADSLAILENMTNTTVCCVGQRGDVNSSGAIDVSDLTDFVDFMFGPGATLCSTAADLDVFGGIDITDLLYLVDHLFNGGAAPPGC